MGSCCTTRFQINTLTEYTYTTLLKLFKGGMFLVAIE